MSCDARPGRTLHLLERPLDRPPEKGGLERLGKDSLLIREGKITDVWVLGDLHELLAQLTSYREGKTSIAPSLATTVKCRSRVSTLPPNRSAQAITAASA